MYEQPEFIIAVSVTLFVGFVIGAIAGRRLSGEHRDRVTLEKQFDELQRRQEDYQHQVTEHFTETGELLNQLAESYREVHNHLVRGAQNLTRNGVSPLQALPEGKPILATEAVTPPTVQPPLDYAPKNPGSKGLLDEDFGLAEDAPKVAEPPRGL